MTRPVGPQGDCVQCGESKAAVRESQRKGGLHVLYCATVDYYGECINEWDRHKFVWSEVDQHSAAAEAAYLE